MNLSGKVEWIITSRYPISIPNSRAFVVTTPKSYFLIRLQFKQNEKKKKKPNNFPENNSDSISLLSSGEYPPR